MKQSPKDKAKELFTHYHNLIQDIGGELGISDDIVNVNGGAIALGHPIGMSGNRLALTLLHELQRRGGGMGAAALCGGGGQGDALIVRTV